MNVNLLIDAIVRQTMVLLAHLATTAGARAPLAHVASQIFLDLSEELAAQGLARKLIADMFGVSLRTYHARIRRLSESATQRGQSLWQAVLDFIRERDVVPRVEVLRRFRHDEEAVVRSVLRDLVDNGFVFSSGRGATKVYRAASAEEMGQVASADPDAALDALVWIAIYHHGPIHTEALREVVRLEPDAVADALGRLVHDGRVEALEPASAEPDAAPAPTLYRSLHYVIPVGAPVGWEAALFDHFQAVVAAICHKLSLARTRSRPGDDIGGSTYIFNVWPGHPLERETLGLLSEIRARATNLRERLDDLEPSRPADLTEDDALRVVFYVGQNVLRGEEKDD